MAAVYVVANASSPRGRNVAVAPLLLTIPDTLVPAPETVNVVSVIDAGAIGSENVAVIVPSTDTPVAAFAGPVETTVGGVESARWLPPDPPPAQAASTSAANDEKTNGWR